MPEIDRGCGAAPPRPPLSPACRLSGAGGLRGSHASATHCSSAGLVIRLNLRSICVRGDAELTASSNASAPPLPTELRWRQSWRRPNCWCPAAALRIAAAKARAPTSAIPLCCNLSSRRGGPLAVSRPASCAPPASVRPTPSRASVVRARALHSPRSSATAPSSPNALPPSSSDVSDELPPTAAASCEASAAVRPTARSSSTRNLPERSDCSTSGSCPDSVPKRNRRTASSMWRFARRRCRTVVAPCGRGGRGREIRARKMPGGTGGRVCWCGGCVGLGSRSVAQCTVRALLLERAAWRCCGAPHMCSIWPRQRTQEHRSTQHRDEEERVAHQAPQHC